MKDNSWKSLTRHSSFRMLWIIILAFLTVTLNSNPAIAQLPSGAIGILSEQKSNAERDAFILVGLFESQDISDQEFIVGQSLYAEAKGAFDGWLDQLKQDLDGGREIDASQQYAVTLKQASEKGDSFRAYVRKKFISNPRGEVAAMISRFLESLTRAGEEVRKEYQAREQHQKEKLLQRLEEFKWRSFEQVRVQ